MTIDEMNRAVVEAQATLNRADSLVGKMARLIRGRLRAANVDYAVLYDLKRELTQFDMRTGRWKS